MKENNIKIIDVQNKYKITKWNVSVILYIDWQSKTYSIKSRYDNDFIFIWCKTSNYNKHKDIAELIELWARFAKELLS